MLDERSPSTKRTKHTGIKVSGGSGIKIKIQGVKETMLNSFSVLRKCFLKIIETHRAFLMDRVWG